MTSVVVKRIKQVLEEEVAAGKLLGGGVYGSIPMKDDDCNPVSKKYEFVSGWRNIQKTKPYTADTIIRLASSTKLMGVVSFLKLIDNGTIIGQENISMWIPEFANTKVIDPKIPTQTVTVINPFRATNGSNIIMVNQPNHGFSSGQSIGVQNSTAVQGISASELNQVHIITVLDANNYTFTVASNATGTSPAGEGGNVGIATVEFGVLQRVFNGNYYYYKEVPLNDPISIWHILTGTLGYAYYSIILGVSFGYSVGVNDPVKIYKAQIQASIINELLIPSTYPLSSFPLSYTGVKEWAKAMALVPLLYQPGTEWCYGPGTSILGALVEHIDGRDFVQYFKEELTDPLGMNNTGFFIYDNDPRRAQKLDLIMDLTTALAPGVFVPLNTLIPGVGIDNYFYGADQPRKLPLIDGGGFSTMDDLTKFYTMLKNNGKTKNGKFFISPALISSISQNKISDLPTYRFLIPSYQFRWGLGVAVSAGFDTRNTLMGQTTRGIFWSGQYGTVYSVDFGNHSVNQFATNYFGVVLTLGTLQPRLQNLHMSALPDVKVNKKDVDPFAVDPRETSEY